MNFSIFILLIFFVQRNYFTNDFIKEIIIDFNNTNNSLSEIQIEKSVREIRFICWRKCRLNLPKSYRNFITDDLKFNNMMSLVMRNGIENVGNVTFCQLNETQNSFVEYFDVPNCCPCCPWFAQRKCKNFLMANVNCSVYILYFINSDELALSLLWTYENINFLLPCKLYSWRENYLKIYDDLYGNDNLYMNYSYGSHQITLKDSYYNPFFGFCINSSAIKQLNHLKCDYGNNRSITKPVHIDIFSSSDFSVSMTIIHQLNKFKSVFFPNKMTLKLLKNQIIEFECGAKFKQRKKKRVLCMKFDLVKQIQNEDFFCKEIDRYLNRSLIINTTNSMNNSKIICHLETPSRFKPKILEYEIELVEKDYLEIDTRLLSTTIPVTEDDETKEFDVKFNFAPINNEVLCEISLFVKEELNPNCVIREAGTCSCSINAEEIFKTRKEVNMSVLIVNKNLKEEVNFLFKPIYNDIPKVLGLTDVVQKLKQLKCQTASSRPYNVSWKLILNDTFSFVSTEEEFPFQLEEDMKKICAECTVTNELGSQKSEEICKTITDIEFHSNNVLEIFLINATVWNNQTKRFEKKTNLSLVNYSIEVLDVDPIILFCASRFKNESLKITYNNSVVESQNSDSPYTKQTYFQFDSKKDKMNHSGRYFCEQNHANNMTKFRSNISITIIASNSPEFRSNFKNGELKWKFIIGQNIHFSLILVSLPSAKIDIYRLNLTEKIKLKDENKTIIRHIINRTHCELKVQFSNISRTDSGKYIIIARNIVNTSHFIFVLEFVEWENNYLIYFVLGGVVLLVLLGSVVLFLCYQKSGYAVPIIQIQNSMYKSIDVDSIQLLNHIWVDPLERKKWTITPSSRIKIIKEIGEGNYGKIYKGILANSSFSSEHFVALKQPILSNNSKGKMSGRLQFCQISLECFMNEIRVLSKLTDCPNIVKMYGCIVLQEVMEKDASIQEPTTLLVLEYYTNRSLNEYIIKNSSMFSPYTKSRKLTELSGYAGMKMDEGITLLDLKKISLGIATGLEYLSSLNIIHRDLATRNVLIDEHRCPKICDFGLAIELETEINLSNAYQILTNNKALPFKILAPEVLETKSFCLKSDIWSFGLLIWQMFNLEQETFFANHENPASLLKYIQSHLIDGELKELLLIPKYADEAIWDLIKLCLTFHPSARPSAHLIRIQLLEIVRNSPVEVIRVSSCSPSEIQESACRDSISSSKLQSTNTSTITLNYPTTIFGNNSNQQNPYFFDEFSTEMLIDESPL